jgi:hypothetical protein
LGFVIDDDINLIGVFKFQSDDFLIRFRFQKNSIGLTGQYIEPIPGLDIPEISRVIIETDLITLIPIFRNQMNMGIQTDQIGKKYKKTKSNEFLMLF